MRVSTRGLAWERLILPLLAAITILAYCQVGEHDFVNYDDGKYIVENPHLEQGLSGDGVAWAFTTLYFSNWHPLTWLSYLLDYELYGLRPSGYHLTNLLLHTAAVLLLFAALRRLTGAVWRSAFVAALFGLHPLHVESVAWISERKDVLSGVFWMLVLWAYAGYAGRPSTRRYLLVALFLALGLLAKPMLVTLPFVLLLLDYWPLGRCSAGGAGTRPDWGHMRRPILEKLPLFLLAAGSSAITLVAQVRSGAVAEFDGLSLASRVGNAMLAYVAYLGKTIWPQELAVFYPHPGDSLSLGLALGAATLLAAITWAALRFGIRRPYLPVGWLWYLGTLVPVIGIVQVGHQSMADRYTYLPLIGLFLAGVWAGSDLLQRWRLRERSQVAGALAALSVLFAVTWHQVGYWRNSFGLFEHALRVTDDNAVAHFNIGTAHARSGNADEAITHYAEALRINPRAFLVHARLGKLLVYQGNSEAARRHRAAALWLISEMDISRKIIRSPAAATALSRPAADHVERGTELARRGDTDDAIREFREALRLHPSSIEARLGLGTALFTSDRRDEAIRHYREALELRPDYPPGHYKLAIAFMQGRRLDLALEHLAAALRGNPTHKGARYLMRAIRAHREPA